MQPVGQPQEMPCETFAQRHGVVCLAGGLVEQEHIDMGATDDTAEQRYNLEDGIG